MIIDQQASSQKRDGVLAPASREFFRHGAQRVAFSSRMLVPCAHQGPGRSARTAFSLVGKRWPQAQVRSGVISCTSEKQALQRRVAGRGSAAAIETLCCLGANMETCEDLVAGIALPAANRHRAPRLHFFANMGDAADGQPLPPPK